MTRRHARKKVLRGLSGALVLGACSCSLLVSYDGYVGQRDAGGSDGAGADADAFGDGGDGGPRRHALVVLGGRVESPAPEHDIDSVEMAPILEDGSLGAFVETTKLPYAISVPAACAVGSSVFLDDESGAAAAVALS